MLKQLGATVRRLRQRAGLTQQELARRSRVSARFLAQLEAGRANISIRRLTALASALSLPASELLAEAEAAARAPEPGPSVALLGLRGAGKSAIGPRLAERLGVRFMELDQEIERIAGLALAQVFELHGEAYYRRLEREVLARLARDGTRCVIATGGSIVTARETYRLLRRHFLCVWLRAAPEDHWNRVVAQGDLRPMARSPHAMEELRALLAARAPLYGQAHHVIDTSRVDVEGAVAELVRELRA
jgi:XRE family aerobic/anaerobic benzoate catabolism transcriptional regulator